MRTSGVRFSLILVVTSVLVCHLGAQRQPPNIVPSFPSVSSETGDRGSQEAPRFLGDLLRTEQRHHLGLLSDEEAALFRDAPLDEVPFPVGVVRTLSPSLEFSQSTARTPDSGPTGGGLLLREPDGTQIWTTMVSSLEADGLRVKLTVVADEHSSGRAFVYSSSGEWHGPYELGGQNRTFWTNTVYDGRIFIEIQAEVMTNFGVRAAIRTLLRVASRSVPKRRPLPGFQRSALGPRRLERCRVVRSRDS